MKSLREVIAEVEVRKIAIGHFNISELAAFRAVARAAHDLGVPVIIGTSEGEREFIDVHEAVAMVRDLREKHGQPVFLNADHTYSMEKVKEAVGAGYDAILFDGAKLSFEENILKTKEVVGFIKKSAAQVLVEGEIGNIGSGSMIRKEMPEGAAIRVEDLTTPEEALRFIKETGVDLLAPAVGNVHGMFANAPEPALDIPRIKAIKEALRQAQGKQVPLVLHGASGNTDEELKAAIEAGVSVIHISTEIRRAWREGVEESLRDMPEEVAPYKLLSEAERGIYEIVLAKLKLFSGLS